VGAGNFFYIFRVGFIEAERQVHLHPLSLDWLENWGFDERTYC
jgi:hypothetical protein